MLLLNLFNPDTLGFTTISFTFQYASIKPALPSSNILTKPTFTFQYASIKPYPAWFDKESSDEFTFQYASIKPNLRKSY